MSDILQMLQSLVIYLVVMAGLMITFPLWIGPFIRHLRVPPPPDSVID